MALTLDDLKRALPPTGVLSSGTHHPPESPLWKDPSGKLKAWKGDIREIRSRALGLPWTPFPDTAPAGAVSGSNVDIACSAVGDSSWTSDEARTTGCLPLGLLTQPKTDKWVTEFRTFLHLWVLAGAIPVLQDVLLRVHPEETRGNVGPALLAYRTNLQQGMREKFPGHLIFPIPIAQWYYSKKGGKLHKLGVDAEGKPERKGKDDVDLKDALLDVMVAASQLRMAQMPPYPDATTARTQVSLLARAPSYLCPLYTVAGQDSNQPLNLTAAALVAALA